MTKRIMCSICFGSMLALICLSSSLSSSNEGKVEAAPANEEANSMLNTARKFLDSGRQNLQATLQSSTSSSISSRSSDGDVDGHSSLNLLSTSSDRDPRLEQQLRQSIKLATDLINNYRQNGLSSLPSLPNLPGVGTVMRLPDKLLRAELSMIQDEIRMAMEMMNNPLAATMNAPRDIASMFYRMAEQLEQ